MEPDFAIVISKVKEIVLFVKYRHAVNNKYKSLMAVENVTKVLCIPVDTRWFTQYMSAKSLLEAKRIVLSISNDDTLMDGIAGTQAAKRDTFLETVREQSFWADLKVFVDNYINVRYSAKLLRPHLIYLEKWRQILVIYRSFTSTLWNTEVNIMKLGIYH
jgi:hypothetical protein